MAVAAFDALLREDREDWPEAEERALLLRATVRAGFSRLRSRPEDWQPGPLHELDPLTAEEHELLLRVLALPAKYRTVVQLQCCEGLTARELTRVMERSEEKVNERIYAAASMLGESGGFDPELYASAMEHIALDPNVEKRVLATLLSGGKPRRNQQGRPRQADAVETRGQPEKTAGKSRKALALSVALTAIAAVCVLATVLIVRAVKGNAGGGASAGRNGGSLASATYESLIASQPGAELAALQALPASATPIEMTKGAVTLADVSYRDGWLYFGFVCDTEASYSIMLCYVDGYRTFFEQVRYLPENSASQAAFFRSYVGFEQAERGDESLVAVGLDYGAEQANVILFYYNWSTGKARIPNQKQDAEWYGLHDEARKAHTAFTRFSIWPESVNQALEHVSVKDLSVIFTEDSAFILNMTVAGMREPLALTAVHPSVTVNGKQLLFAGEENAVDFTSSGKTYQETSTEENLASFFYYAAQPFDELPDPFTVEVSFSLFDASTAGTQFNLPPLAVSGTFAKSSFSVENNG